jgi:MFS family permease
MGGWRSLGGMGLCFMSDKVGRAMAYSLGSAAAFVGIVLLTSIQDTSPPWRLYPFVLMYGLGYGALGPVYAAAAVELSPGPQFGRILWLLEARHGLGGAFGTFMAGYFYDVLDHYTVFCALVLAAIALSSACLRLAAPYKACVIRS